MRTQTLLFVMRPFPHIFLSIVAIQFIELNYAVVNADDFTATNAVEFVQQYCVGCHDDFDAQAGLNLEHFTSAQDLAENREAWRKVLRRVKQHEMPPIDGMQPELDERNKFIDWVAATMHEQICGDGQWQGPAPIRRLNKNEYRATIRDLLGIHFDAAHGLPDDGAGGEGFDNAAETLFLSPLHAEMYLEAAREALAYAANDSRAQRILFVARPNDDLSAHDAARQVLSRFALRAYRRPPSDDEVERLMELFRSATEAEQSFDEAIFYTLRAVLISPHFLFRIEQPYDDEGAGDDDYQPQPVNDYELATRLSYFLWGSMPDDKLIELAGEGKLSDASVLRRQMERMLNDEKSRGLAENFTGQWLGVRRLGRDVKPSAELFPQFNYELEDGMKQEPIRFFQEVFSKNHSLLTLVDSDFTYVNRALARHYEVKGEPGQEIREWSVRVPLPEDSPRGGVITMAAVLTSTSHPHRTSPVLRGVWVMETMLGAESPPPPPDVPDLPEEPQARAATLRERLEQHRDDPSCASCHNTIDPVGFSLENFDPIGRWRTKESGQPVDVVGELPTGEIFTGPDGLKELLLERKAEFLHHFTTKMLGYALGRGLIDLDYCEVDRITRRVQDNGYEAQALMWEIINSTPFRSRGVRSE